MHSLEDYTKVGNSILRLAQEIGRKLKDHYSEPFEIFTWFVQNGWLGAPTGGIHFATCSWLNSTKHSSDWPRDESEAKQAVGLIPCFSDDDVPLRLTPAVETYGKSKVLPSGFFDPEWSAVVLTNVDWFSTLELALHFFHEVRHAYNECGKRTEGLKRLDPPELEEARGWSFVFRILDACGGKRWQTAVQTEFTWLRQRLRETGRAAGGERFLSSGVYRTELDSLFKPTDRPEVRGSRANLTAMRANILAAEQAGVDRDTACARAVDALYKHVQQLRSK